MGEPTLYTRDHQWVRREGATARVGVSAFAQRELGEIAYVELPRPGAHVRAGEAVCSIDSMKSTSEIIAPLTGTVVDVNTRLSATTTVGLVNQDPEGEGWLFTLRIERPDELSTLLTAEEYESYVKGS